MSFGLRFENKDSSRFRLFATFLSLAALISINVACEETTSQTSTTLPSTTPTPGGPGGTPTPTPTIPPVGGKMTIRALFPSTATTYFHKNRTAGADWTVACDANPNDSVFANRDVNCVVEANELDLFYNEFRFQWEVPPEACHYVYYRPYWFYAYEPGYGPTSVSMTITDGAITASSAMPTNSELVIREGAEACKYDYTHLPDGQNCCYGSYTLTTQAIDTAAGTNTTTVEQKEWGGAFGNCIAGPGKTAWQNFSKVHSLPVASLKTAWSGITGEHVIPSAIGLNYRTNLHASNMVKNDADIWARESIIPLDLAGAAGGWGQPYYQWQCLDQAKEVKAQFKIFVREWNQHSEFLRGVAGIASADPDTAGVEPPWPTPAPPGGTRENPNTDYNDYDDWDDIIAGISDFIQDLL